MAQREFGNRGTEEKLDTVFSYANAYLTLLKKQNFRLHYLDVFAGSGIIPTGFTAPLLDGIDDVDTVIEGSAFRALKANIPFDHYVFSDIKRNHTVELKKLKAEFPALARRIDIRRGDANEIVRQFCGELGPMDRALVFLDPFGNQVEWDTLVALANTEKVDVWYLFPSWIGISRQIGNSGALDPDAEASIARITGDPRWKENFIKEFENPQPDLFGSGNNVETRKVANIDSVTRYMIGRMKTIFRGGVSDSWLPLGRGNRVYYSLLFAVANPGAKARSIAQRVASHIMTRK